MKIGHQLRTIRQKRKYSQEYMANAIGISQPHYNRLENNEATLSVDRLYKIAEILEVPIEELLPQQNEVYFFNHAEHNKGSIHNHGEINYHHSDDERQALLDLVSQLKQEIQLLRKAFEDLQR